MPTTVSDGSTGLKLLEAEMFADLAICPEDGRDGKTSSRHVDVTAFSAAPFGTGSVLSSTKCLNFNCLKPVESPQAQFID